MSSATTDGPSLDAGPQPETPDGPDLEDDSTDESLFNRAIGTLTDLQLSLGEQHAANLAAGAIMLLVTLIIVLLAALVGGEFSGAIPSDSVFSSAITTTTDNAGTAFVIFGVSLLAIPAVSVLAYIVVRLGPFVGGFGGNGDTALMSRR